MEASYTTSVLPHLEDRDLYKRVYEDLHRFQTRQNDCAHFWMMHFHPVPGSSIIELGAANGPNMIYYARMGHTVDGVELSSNAVKSFLKQREKETEEVQERTRMWPGWIEDFKPDTEYDHVLCCEVLEHVIDPVAVLRVAHDCLKPYSGELYITAPTWRNPHEFSHVRAVNMKAFREWCEQTDLYIFWHEEKIPRSGEEITGQHRVFAKARRGKE